jgi:hypothetical protein
MQQTAITSPRVESKEKPRPTDYAGARRWLWRAMIIILVGTWAGTTWDRVWHATTPFDGFWSPPHVVVYVTAAFVGLLFIGMTFTDHIRRAFGQSFKVFFLPFPVPGALFILNGAMVMLGFAGAVLDNIWHSNFGLDETAWSFPHAMIGWSLWLLVCGFLASRLALAHDKPMPTSSKVLVGVFLVWMAFGLFTGPIGDQRTPEQTRFYYSVIPALASQESAQHVFRIYEAFNLNRTHPALLVLAPLWLGAALAFIRKLDGRWWFLLLLMVLIWLMDAGDQNLNNLIAQYIPAFEREANWRSLPVVLPTLLWLLFMRPQLPERLAYALAGVLFSLMIYDIWAMEASAAWLLAFAAIPAIWLGKAIGERAYNIIAQPHSFRAVLPLMLAGVLVPLATGVIDLILRAQIP